MIKLLNPATLHPPGSVHSHAVEVTAGSNLLFFSGQIGMRVDGSVPDSLAEQSQQVYANLDALLAAHGLDAGALVKLSLFVVSGQDMQTVRAARAKFLGPHRPASTAMFVSQLVDPAWLVEVEAIAARS